MNVTVSSSTTTPGNPDPNDFYDAAPLEPHLLYQGEILVNVPIIIMPKPPQWRLLRSYDEVPLHEQFKKGRNPRSVRVLDAGKFDIEWDGSSHDGDYVMGRLCKAPALILSQTCDVQDKDFVQVAPIFPAVGNNPEYIGRLEAGKIFSAFHLKARPPELGGPSFADFERMQAVHKSYIRKLDAKQHFRLKEDRVRLLQRALTRYFGRPNSYDVEADKVPGSGVYMCVQCFYSDGNATAVTLEKDGEFQNCTVCGGHLWVRRGL
jgi:hypothetical protein